jgi:hypothetical protein
LGLKACQLLQLFEPPCIIKHGVNLKAKSVAKFHYASLCSVWDHQQS